MVYPILPPLSNLIRSHKYAPKKSLGWLLAGLNFHKAARFETDDMTGQKTTWKVLESMCFQGSKVLLWQNCLHFCYLTLADSIK